MQLEISLVGIIEEEYVANADCYIENAIKCYLEEKYCAC